MAGIAAGGKCVEMETGIVRKWDAVRGYGFIQSDTLKNDNVFIHIKSLMRVGLDSLRIGQRVRFNVAPSRTRPGGICAEDIELL
jgi:cold shock CspA family protein